MGVVLAVTNQKGGVGKSTSCVNLAAAIANQRRKVLVVDVDPQGNTTSGFGVNKQNLTQSTYNLLINSTEAVIDEVLLSVRKNITLIPANIDLAGAEVELVAMEQREYKLKESLAEVKDKYDYIFLDCPPSLGLLTINSLIAADAVLIPVQAEYYALEGLMQLFTTLEMVKQRFSSSLRLAGVFVTMYDSRTQLSKQVFAEIQKHFASAAFNNIIPRNVRLSEAPSHGMTIFEFDDWSKGARSYRKLAKDLVKRLTSDAWQSGKIGELKIS